MSIYSPSDPTCVLALEFEGNATDLSSNGNNGTLNGDAGFAAGLVSGQWLILDGSGDFVSRGGCV